KQVPNGHFLMIFTSRKRCTTYLGCTGIGIHTWIVIGILAACANDFAQARAVTMDLHPALGTTRSYEGLVAGGLVSGVISHRLHSRKKAVLLLMFISFVGTLMYLFAGIKNAHVIYALFVMLGFGIGYWAMFVTIGAEQFGTNLRATAATTVPNMVRG